MRLVIRLLLKVILWSVVLGIPLAGVWIASAMAAMLNGPVWLTALGGALLFPILPASWDLLALWRRRRREARRRSRSGRSFFADLAASRRSQARMRVGDRLLLRTLLLNGLFVGGLLWKAPATATTALTARGDWMLDHAEGDWVPTARRALLAVADLTSQLAAPPIDNPYADLGETAPPPLPEITGRSSGVARTLPITLRLPEGAMVRVRGSALTLTGTPTVDLVPGAHELVVQLTNGRELLCPLTASAEAPVVGLVPGEPWYLAAAPCNEIQAPDPEWRPAVHLAMWSAEPLTEAEAHAYSGSYRVEQHPDTGAWLLLEPEPLLTPADVATVQIREPYVRLTVTEAARETLCDKTDTPYLEQLVAVVDGKVRYAMPKAEKLCDGQLSFPMRADVAQNVIASDPVGEELRSGDTHGWPWTDAAPHPVVQDLPPEVEGSIGAVGRHLVANIPDEMERLKAVHDYVATRIAYDVDSLEEGKRAPQDADTVFRQREGVCAGYANLMVALGEAAALRVVYLSGQVRDEHGEINSAAHAWNAAQVDGQWYLIDATWDAGSVGDEGCEARYATGYLLTPPEVFRSTHLPSEPAWQLSPTPITAGDFTRLPVLEARFYAAGFSLLEPTRSQVTVAGKAFDLRIANPQRQFLIVTAVSASGAETRCEVQGTTTLAVHCALPRAGRYSIQLFQNRVRSGAYDFAGRLMVNAG